MTARLDPSIRAGWIAFNAPLEGSIPWPYLDIRQLVTVAHGVLVPNRQVLLTCRWRSDVTGERATAFEVNAAWDALMGDAGTRARMARLGAGEARRVVKITLPPEELDRVTLAKYDEQERDLLRRYPALPSWPVEAQTVCASIAWAAGTGAAFPKMYAAMHRGDWLTAADECALRVDNPDGSRNAGLIPRNRRNRALLESLAARLGQTRTPAVDAVPDPAPTVDEPPDTDPMTDAQRREALALVEATSNQASIDAIEAAYRAR